MGGAICHLRGMSQQHWIRCLILLSFLSFCLQSALVLAVKREDFKTCAQSGFCTRQRAYAQLTTTGDEQLGPLVSLKQHYHIEPATIQLDAEHGLVSATVISSPAGQRLQWHLVIQMLLDGTLRIQLDEQNSLRQRHRANFGLQAEPVAARLVKIKQDASKLVFSRADRVSDTVSLFLEPFKVVVSSGGKDRIALNAEEWLNIEHLRARPTPQSEPEPQAASSLDGESMSAEAAEVGAETVEEGQGVLAADLQRDQWEETFKSWTDSKPRGPTSVAADVHFLQSAHLYGLAEHASGHQLKSTGLQENNHDYHDPYRLYNTDICEYELDNTMSLYGAVPYIIGMDEDGSAHGVFWYNTAETWVDVAVQSKSTRTHWISESGILDLFVLLGPTPNDLFRQFARLTGAPFAPPLTAIGYHQCRWNYNDKNDVETLNDAFNSHDIPVDVLWLDIEHTQDKKYFTWDATNFANSTGMLQTLENDGRALVNIIDPHLKVESDYAVYQAFKREELYIKNRDGTPLEGHCWPGKSSWPDYTLQRARELWASLFDYLTYRGTAPNLYVWNDMNEPSVFDQPEVTMARDALHAGDVEHRDVHNVYGMMQVMSTYDGLLQRDHPTSLETTRRPFILTRSFYAGIQRYSAVWTGDNAAEWSHLKVSIPMLLTIGVNGVIFNGADVGGFFNNPHPALLARWYQLGAWTPFFRAHAHIDTKRREPHLLPEPYRSIAIRAIRLRYLYLPVWYTLFMLAHFYGTPIMRPLWSVFPANREALDLEEQFMVGERLLIAPVVDEDADTKVVYLPNGAHEWYALHDEPSVQHVQKGDQGTYLTVTAGLEQSPAFVRHGTILPLKPLPRKSGRLMLADPIVLYIYLDAQGRAEGSIYLDDGETFAYRGAGHFIYRQIRFAAHQLDWSKAKLPDTLQGPIAEHSDTNVIGDVWVTEIRLYAKTTAVASALTIMTSAGTAACSRKDTVAIEDVDGKTQMLIWKCRPGQLLVRDTWSLHLK